MTTNSLRVALVQFTPSPGDVHSNLSQMLGFLGEAALQRADMVCFPELCLPGYMLDPAKYTDEVLKDLRQADTRLQAASRDLQVRIMYGTAHYWGRRLHNCVQVSEPDGTRTVYVKTHMVDAERAVFSAGRNLVVTADGNLGLGCCYDLAFPGFSASLADAGARVLCFPMAWEQQRAFVFEGIVTARAIENIAYVVCVNQTGALGTTRFHGGSRIVDPLGRTLCQMGDTIGLVVADIDLDEVTRLRASVDTRTYPLLADRRTGMPVRRGLTCEQLWLDEAADN